MGIEMKTHGFRKIRQPEHRSLQAHQFAACQRRIQCRHARFFAAKTAHVQAHTQLAAAAADNAFGRHTVGHQRLAAQLYQRNIGKGERSGHAEHHRFIPINAVMAQQRRHHPTFAMGGVLMLK